MSERDTNIALLNIFGHRIGLSNEDMKEVLKNTLSQLCEDDETINAVKDLALGHDPKDLYIGAAMYYSILDSYGG